jgi:hypothetical protein
MQKLFCFDAKHVDKIDIKGFSPVGLPFNGPDMNGDNLFEDIN